MAILHLAILAIVQGITEFLPVSSSAHLVLVPLVAGWPDQGLLIDVAVHVGTLGAVLLYFWRDIWEMLRGLVRLLRGKRDSGARLAGLIIVSSVPVIAAGYGLHHYIPGGIRDITVIGWATVGFGLVLWVADSAGMTLRRVEHLTVVDALIVGAAQVLALIPGTSRSGISMTACRLLGMERPDAARFSMLLSIPAILGAGVLGTVDLVTVGDPRLTADVLIAVALAFGSALVSIALLMAWLRHAGFLPFTLYRLALGVLILAVAYGWIGGGPLNAS